jgi:lipopolysaccharide/colanic/teichoic acid biosynthesis glycosyltransferase
MPVLIPLGVVLAILTKLSSPGPVLFKQARIGIHGRQFMLYKFRTMKLNADTTGHQAYLQQLMASGAPMTKLDSKGDSRLNPGGWLLRATGLDELPQLINVLKGDMSLVGPRPCIPYEYEGYTEHQKQRFSAHPGLTGLWQVSGKNRTTFDAMINFDIEYSKRRSFGLDFWIIGMTLPALAIQVLDTWRSRSSRNGQTPAPVKQTSLRASRKAPGVLQEATSHT